MSQESPKDTVSFILAQEQNLQEVLRHLSNADDWIKTAQDQIDLANNNLIARKNIEGSIGYFIQAEDCLEKALFEAESTRKVEKLSKEAEKAGLRSTELINNINTINFDIGSKKSFLESIEDAMSLENWSLVYQYGMDASKLWVEKDEYFMNIANEAKAHMTRYKSSRFSKILERLTSKKST